MRKSVLFCAVLAFSMLAASCMSGVYDDKGLPVGTLFYTGSPVSFYFVDENGADLLDITDYATLPAAYPNSIPDRSRRDALMSMHEVEASEQTWLYNGESNSLSRDKETGLLRFNTYLWGVTPKDVYRMYLYWCDEELTIDITYEYTTSVNNPDFTEGSWAVAVTSMN